MGQCMGLALIRTGNPSFIRSVLIIPLSEVNMRKQFVTPVLREEAMLAQLTLQSCASPCQAL